MSRLVGSVSGNRGTATTYVHTSLGGIEVNANELTVYSPDEARAYADILRAAADGVERARTLVASEIAADPAMAEVHSVTAADIAAWREG